MTTKMITAYRSMMMSYIKNNREYKTIDELGLNEKEFDFLTNFIRKNHTNVNVISSNKCIHIEPKNILEEVNCMVKKELYLNHIFRNSYIKIPEYKY